MSVLLRGWGSDSRAAPGTTDEYRRIHAHREKRLEKLLSAARGFRFFRAGLTAA